MQCPNCGRSMTYDRKDVTHANGFTYDREHFECSDECGTWVAVETPRKENE